MNSSLAADFTYRYPYASNVGTHERGFGLSLATCGAQHEHPYFFDGLVEQPRFFGLTLLTLFDVVRTHFYLPRPVLLDPVVTSSESMLRFEGFSGCCGVYARADFPPEAFQSDLQHRGTTNVDFNPPMRSALGRLRDNEDVRLSVGQDEVALSRSDEKVVEKKVKLPMRWLKGFSEVQSYQAGLQPKIEVSGSEARRFIRSLPQSGGPKRPSFATQTGKSLRLSQRENKDAVRIHGTHRVRVLEPLMVAAKGLRVWADDSGSSGWEMLFDKGRFFLLLSPEVYRGFSGEGQVLEKLAVGNWESALSSVQAQLTWQSHIDTAGLSELTGWDQASVEAALAVLGSRGLAGFDVTSGAYFHRILPFDLDQVDRLQPRLKNARKLLEKGGVKLLKEGKEGEADLAVRGTDVTHTVRLRPDLDRCSCPWFSKHQGERGPCKHILAAKIFLERDKESGAA
ncbi:MAG: SWIM zinc finger family protein, partial [Candidatus Omnitrophica bacterium]|nr:SWIM zinc finger family protein [Candidatus Omnitrophota bacterium]